MDDNQKINIYNFEDVKNYVEVYGKQHEPSEVATAYIPPNSGYINLTLTKGRDKYVNGTWCIEFDIGDGLDPVMLSTFISAIYVYDKDNSATPWFSVLIGNEPITMGNESYCIKMTVGVITSVVSGEYLGYMQPRAYAFENNPQSPFYVGQFKEYTCALGTSVDFASEREAVITVEDNKYNRYLDKKITLTEEKQYMTYDVTFDEDMSADIKFQLGNIGSASAIGAHKVEISDIKWTKKNKNTAGDANGDGVVAVSDLVLFSRRLLGDAVTVISKNVDLCNDGIFDVYDLIRLREILLEK